MDGENCDSESVVSVRREKKQGTYTVQRRVETREREEFGPRVKVVRMEGKVWTRGVEKDGSGGVQLSDKIITTGH